MKKLKRNRHWFGCLNCGSAKPFHANSDPMPWVCCSNRNFKKFGIGKSSNDALRNQRETDEINLIFGTIGNMGNG